MVDISSKLKGKVVSITGASGYIGSALTQELEKYSLKIIRISRKQLTPKDGIEDWVLNLNKKSSWMRIVSKSDIIFHLSGNTSIYNAEKDPKESLISTIFPIIQLINASKKLSRIPRVIFSSTATVYGLTEALPVLDTKQPNPITTYDLHKFFAEQQLLMASSSNIINAISLRLANVYGPSPTESLAKDRGILSMITKRSFALNNLQIYGNGDYLRDYIYIDDVVNAFLHTSVMDYDILLNKKQITLNVASGKGTSVKEVFDLISHEVEKITGIRGNIEYVAWPEEINEIEKRNYIASIELIKSLTEWKPSVSLEKGIQLLVKHYSKESIGNEVS
jgi:nucleoside-diphosphate-sugar epimerase